MRITIALLAVALLAGCGSSQPRLTKAEFTQRASAICSRYSTYLQGLRAGVQAGNVAQEQALVAQALPVIRSGHDELRTLRPPQELQAAYDRWLDASDREVKAVEQLADALQSNDFDGALSAVKSLAGTNLAQLQADSAALGLTECESS
jgi:hypothetical protein